MISIIAAIGKNHELGKDNRLLWHIPEDLKRFKNLTLNQIVVMGRKTFESLPIKPLPKRINVVITKDKNFFYNQVLVYNDFSQAIKDLKEKVKNNIFFKNKKIFIIGGESVYKQAIDIVDELYLTIVNKDFPEADCFFPDYQKKFQTVDKKTKNLQDYQITFLRLIKKV